MSSNIDTEQVATVAVPLSVALNLEPWRITLPKAWTLSWRGLCCVKCCWCSSDVLWWSWWHGGCTTYNIQCARCSAKVVHVCPSLTASLVLGVATCPVLWVMLLPGIQLVRLMSQHCLEEYSRCGWILGTCCTCNSSLCKKADYIWDYVWNIVSVEVETFLN